MFFEDIYNKVTFFLSAKIALVFAFFADYEQMLLSVYMLMLIDFITGLYKSLKINKESISSAKFGRKWAFFVSLHIAIITAINVDIFLNQLPFFKNWFATFILATYAIYEAISILENLAEITKHPFLRVIISKLLNKVPAEISETIKEIEKLEDENEK